MNRNEQAESDNYHHSHREESSIIGSLREAPGDARVEKLRSIVKAGSLMLVEGQLVDLFSANVAVQVHDALKPENRDKLMNKDKSVMWTLKTALAVAAKVK